MPSGMAVLSVACLINRDSGHKCTSALSQILSSHIFFCDTRSTSCRITKGSIPFVAIFSAISSNFSSIKGFANLANSGVIVSFMVFLSSLFPSRKSSATPSSNQPSDIVSTLAIVLSLSFCPLKAGKFSIISFIFFTVETHLYKSFLLTAPVSALYAIRNALSSEIGIPISLNSSCIHLARFSISTRRSICLSSILERVRFFSPFFLLKSSFFLS